MLTTLRGWRRAAAAVGGLADCTLVVATYERTAEICALLHCLHELPDSPGEVVVVDGSSGYETQAAIAAWAWEHELAYHLIYVRSPAGLTLQRNVGVDASNGSFVFFLDDDCLPEPGYFRAIRQVFLEDEVGAVGGVCGSIVNEMARPLSLRWRVRLALRIAPAGEAGQYQSMGVSMPLALQRPFSGVRRVAVVPGGAVAFRRTVLERHRFSRFFHGYSQGEDVEMSLRVGREYTLLWSGDAHVIHHHALGGRPASLEKGRMEFRNHFYIWKRYARDASVLDRIRFWSDTAYSILYDLASIIRRPVSAGPLRHMLGSLRGVLECLVSPPVHDEEPAVREYDFDLEENAPSVEALTGVGATRGGDVAGGRGATPTHGHP